MKVSSINKHLIISVGFCGFMLYGLNVSAGDKGKSVYDSTCKTCHGAGVMGAPKLGSKEDWADRIAQGKETLYKHAIEGFKGKKGMMPPKGGKSKLPDADVKAAVDYLVANAK